MSEASRQRILLVDDDEHLLVVVGDCLRFEGYDVVMASGGEEALRVLRGQPRKPDLVLLDVMMPGMDGGCVADEIRNDPTLADIPVVFLTAVVSKGETASHRGVIGGKTFMAKPVQVEDLLAVVREHIRPS